MRGAFRSRDLLDGVLAGARLARPAVSDAHEGLKAAAARVLDATWQRCRVHFMRNILTHADTTSLTVSLIPAAILRSVRRVAAGASGEPLCDADDEPLAQGGD